MTSRCLIAVALVACGDDGAHSPDASTSDASPDAVVTGCDDGAGWTSAPPVIDGPTQETAVVELAGRIYVLGGFDNAFAVLDTVQVFDPSTCTWSAGPTLPAAVHHVNAAVHGGRIYVLGALVGAQFTSIGATWSIDPSAETTWSVHTPMPAGSERGASATAPLGDAIVVAGGLRGGAVAQVSAYTPSTDTWSEVAPLPAPRDHGCGVSVGAAAYVIGGRGAALDGTVVALSTLGGSWDERAPMATPRGGIACGVVGTEVIVAGGEGNRANATGVFDEVAGYDAATDTWRDLPRMTSPRHGMGGAGYAGRFYTPGGGDREGFAAVATHEVLLVP